MTGNGGKNEKSFTALRRESCVVFFTSCFFLSAVEKFSQKQLCSCYVDLFGYFNQLSLLVLFAMQTMEPPLMVSRYLLSYSYCIVQYTVDILVCFVLFALLCFLQCK